MNTWSSMIEKGWEDITIMRRLNVKVLHCKCSLQAPFVYWLCRIFIFSEDVMFEFHPTYDKSDASANSDRPHACLVWLGDEKSRPKYLGQVSPSWRLLCPLNHVCSCASFNTFLLFFNRVTDHSYQRRWTKFCGTSSRRKEWTRRCSAHL